MNTTKSRPGVANGGFVLVSEQIDEVSAACWHYYPNAERDEYYTLYEFNGEVVSCTCADWIAHSGDGYHDKHQISLELWLAGWRWDDPPRVTHRPSVLKVGTRYVQVHGAAVVIDGVRGEYIRADRWVPDGVKARIGAVYAYDVWTRGADAVPVDPVCGSGDGSGDGSGYG